MPRLRCVLVVVLLSLLFTESNSAAPEIRLSINPQIATTTIRIRFTITIAPAETDRVIGLSADNGEFFRETLLPIEGASAAKQHVIIWYAFPEGQYEVTAGVGNGRTWRARTRQYLTVV